MEQLYNNKLKQFSGYYLLINRHKQLFKILIYRSTTENQIAKDINRKICGVELILVYQLWDVVKLRMHSIAYLILVDNIT